MQFYYKAADPIGEIHTGKREGESREEIVAELRKQDLYALQVKEIASKKRRFGRQRLKREDLMVFTPQLAGLLEAGIQLNKAIEILVNLLERHPLGPVVKDLHLMMHEGASFSQALENKKEVFDPLFINLIKVGEAGGLLPQIMARLSNALESEINLRNKLISNLTYPAMVFSLSIVATVFLLWQVVPKFELFFVNSGEELPLITQIVLNLSRGLTGFAPPILGAALVLLFLLHRYFQTPNGRWVWDRFWLQTPFFGEIILQMNMAGFSRNLGMLLKSGVPLLEGVGLLKKTMPNRVLARLLAQAESEVRKGGSLARFFSRQKQVPLLVTQMVGVGEEAGNLAEMCEHLGRFYENELSRKIEGLLSLLGPLLVLFLTALIFLLALSVVLPILNLDIPI